MQVVALIEDQNGAYSALFPDFPGCTTTADDPDALIAKASEALSDHIGHMIASGRELPQVRSLSRLADDPVFLADSAGLMIALVPYTPAARAVRLEITVDESLLALVDRAAEAVGETRSEYLARAARQRIGGGAMSDSDVTSSAVRPTQPSPDVNVLKGRSDPELARSDDTEASLACIKEILERLDSPPVKRDRQPIPKLQNSKGNQRLILRPAR